MAATMEEIIQSKYQPANPENVKVEPVANGHLVSWSPSLCVENYDVSYKTAEESKYTTNNVQGNSETITFTTLPDASVSERLSPLVSADTESATVRWAASEKLSCIPRYEVQLCQAESGVCQPAEMMDRDDSVKFMEFSAPAKLEMCSDYKLEIRPQHDKTTV